MRFDGAAEKPIRLIKHTGPVNDVVVLNGGDEKEGDRMIVSAGADHTIRVWNAADGELVRTFDNHTGAVQSLAVRPQAEGLPMIASASADRTIRFWQPTIGRMVRFLRLDDAPLAIAFTPGGDKLLAATVAGELIVIDPDAAEITTTLPGIEGWAYSLAVTPDGKHALIAGAGGEKKLLQLK